MTWLKETEHGLAPVGIVLATAPAHDGITVEVELEIVEQIWWIRWRNAV